MLFSTSIFSLLSGTGELVGGGLMGIDFRERAREDRRKLSSALWHVVIDDDDNDVKDKEDFEEED